MDTDTIRTAEAECQFCGKALSKLGRGSHEKSCRLNPANKAPSESDALRARITERSEKLIADAAEALEQARWLLCDATPEDEPEWQGRAAEEVGNALDALKKRAGLIELLMPPTPQAKKGARNGR